MDKVNYTYNLPVRLSEKEGLDNSPKTNFIHPINVGYIMETLPHRFYNDEAGEILEITVLPIASRVVEQLYGHGAIIGLRYQSKEGEEQTYATYILRSNGEVYLLHDQLGEVQEGIGYDLFYMLLNPLCLNGWYPKEILQERNGSKSFAAYGGMRLEDIAQPNIELVRVVDEIGEAYIRSLSDRR